MAPNPTVVDLHLHSRFSLATSPQLNLPVIAATAARKGIDLAAAPDFTHPHWRKEMRSSLEEVAEGAYRLVTSSLPDLPGGHDPRQTTFILVTEISCVWKHGSRTRRVHVLLMLPSFSSADGFSRKLSAYQDLESDGRPVVKLSVADLYAMAIDVDDRAVLFPAHAWTPWYGVFGSKSGFDSLEECFGEYASMVPAIETGLSTDPQMNWTFSDVSGRSIVSFSDAHSPSSMGREMTVLEAEGDFPSVRDALFENRVIETVELHPGHGKYYLNGHRKCGVKLEPVQTSSDGRCPVCGKPLTLGVLQRVTELSDVPPLPVNREDGLVYGNGPHARPFRQLVPLREVIGLALTVGANSRKVGRVYSALLSNGKTELSILTTSSYEEIREIAGEDVASAIVANRDGQIEVDPGFDGIYGAVSLPCRT